MKMKDLLYVLIKKKNFHFGNVNYANGILDVHL